MRAEEKIALRRSARMVSDVGFFGSLRVVEDRGRLPYFEMRLLSLELGFEVAFDDFEVD
jgi:hypothetical protein